jgi:hypothetical protein
MEAAFNGLGMDLRVTITGAWLEIDIGRSTTAFWYQAEPHTPFPRLPDVEFLEVI